jgi:hypothetical protein
VVLEITDVTGHGLVTDNKGVPQFHEPDSNTDTLSSNIETVGTFTNTLGQTVTQVVSVIPARKLKREKDSWITPPINIRDPTVTQYSDGFPIPNDAVVEIAKLRLRVIDRSGAISPEPPTHGNLHIGFAEATYAPPPNPEPPGQ